MLTHKVIELGTVTEETIEEALNEWTAKGWHFDGMQFAMRESSRRPSMAFILFTREELPVQSGGVQTNNKATC